MGRPDPAVARSGALVSLRLGATRGDLGVHQSRAHAPGPGDRHLTSDRPDPRRSRHLLPRPHGWRRSRGARLARVRARPASAAAQSGQSDAAARIRLGSLARTAIRSAGPILITTLAFFYTYLYNKTGSVLLVILLHACITPANDTLILMPRQVHGVTDVVIFGTVLLAAVALTLMTRGRLGYDSRSSRVMSAS